MPDGLQIISTSDGSHSLLNQKLNETYHSTHGAIQESTHVFVKNGLQFWIDENKTTEVSILEVGFGTGLNALLALKESIDQKIKIHYTSLEAFPVSVELAAELNYPKQIDLPSSEKFFGQLHSATWNISVAITPDFILEKREGKIQEMILDEAVYDLVFFDAFAPSTQPEMWENAVLKKVVHSIKPNGVFVTYSAQGQLKRNLKLLGLLVESLSGPPGKREMVRGMKGS